MTSSNKITSSNKMFDDINKGEIYKITNKTEGKSYIGGCKKYTSKNNNTWGTIGRWKSHIIEATSGKKDHCRLLNQAIRKYKPENFDIIIICECENKELDEKEIYYIKEFNTLSPNGYNLTTGGAKGKDCEETKQKKSAAKKGIKQSEEAKINSGKGQIGNRRDKIKRKHEEDNDLPTYIQATRLKGILIGYSVSSFPTGIEEKKYISTSFKNTKNPDEALEKAKKKLEELKLEYSSLPSKIEEIKKEMFEEKVEKKKIKKDLDKLLEFIFPIYKDKTKIGFYVEGIVDNNGNLYPKKDFIDCQTLKWNLDQAKKYVHSLDVKNKDEKYTFDVNQEYAKSLNVFEKSVKRKYGDDENNLPKYISVYRAKGEKIGYNIAGFKVDGKKYTRKFSDKKLTMEEKYKLALEKLDELRDKINT